MDTVEVTDKKEKGKTIHERAHSRTLKTYSHPITWILKYAESKLCFVMALNSFLGQVSIKKTLQNCQKAE